jgi:hypothetical protein
VINIKTLQGTEVYMINKIHFFGCSVTAGNELWEEAHIPDYAKMDFKAARKCADHIDGDEIAKYNIDNSFPALTATKLDVDFENHGVPGISNKEIACRAIAQFPEDHYENVAVYIQFTTHNRLLLKYKETENDCTVGSFVIHPQAVEDRLTKRQDNLVKEFYLEFMNETVLSYDDHVFLYYAVEVLRSKGIDAWILWCDIDVINWANWEDSKMTILQDTDPQYGPNFSKHLSESHYKYNPFNGGTMRDIVDDDAQLPRYHYKKTAHEQIADKLAERIKNV